VYEIITGSAARYNFGAHYNKAAHCTLEKIPSSDDFANILELLYTF